jgi:PAS domain S-box-containing protein
MTSWKKIALWAVLLLPVTLTILSGLVQMQYYQHDQLWIGLGFYCIIFIFSLWTTGAVVHFKTRRNDDGIVLPREKVYKAVEELPNINLNIINEKTRKETEESKDLLINSIKDYAIFIIDTNGNVSSWNKGAEYIKGYRAEEIIGHPFEIFYTEDDARKHIPARNLQMAREKGSHEDEGLRIRKDGTLFWASVIHTSLRDNNGLLTGYATVTKNINRQKELERELHKHNIELETKITERTAEIYSHENRFRALIENNYDAISLLDSSFKSIYRSPSASRITGWSDDEVSKISGEKLIHPDETILVGRIFSDSMKNPGKPVPLLFRCLHKKGHFIWLEGTLTNMLNDGNVNAIVLNVHDATERILYEKKMRESQEELAYNEMRFRALIENSVEGIVLMDELSNIIYNTPAALKITGDVPAENVISRAHPEDIQSFQAKLGETLRNPGIPISFRGRFQHADGHYFWIEGTLTNMLHVQGIWRIVLNFRDVTEKKAAEENLMNSEKLYRNLFENMLNGFAYCKCIFKNEQLIDFTFLTVNEEYEVQTGLKGLTGKNVSEVMPGLLESDREYCRIVSQVALTGKPDRFETYVEPMDKWFAISLFSPSTGYFVGLIDNITERKKSEYKVNRLNIELEKRVVRRTEQLKEKNDEMEAFSYSVSHDLRAPLRSIIGFTRILEEEYSSQLDDEARRLTTVIKSNTEKMGNLIDDLLTFSRMGRHEIAKIIIDTNMMVEQVILELQQKTGFNQISWTIHPMHSMFGDSTSMRQVWVNLLSNAIKYSAGQSVPEIEISSFRNQDEIVFRVRDNGVGFDPKYTNKLFKVFQRLHGMAEFEGTGVGLAIVEKIISRHEGRVWAEGEVNNGASFYFGLPVN